MPQSPAPRPPAPSSDTFASRLRAARKHSGLSVDDLAERADLSIDQIRYWERGLHAPSRFPLLMARSLGLTLDEFRGLSDHEIRKARDDRSLSRADLAYLVGCTSSTIERLEKSKHRSYIPLLNISQALGIAPDELLPPHLLLPTYRTNTRLAATSPASIHMLRRIRVACSWAGISITALARTLRIPVADLRDIHARPLRIKLLEQIARATEVSVDFLIGATDDLSPSDDESGDAQ